MKKVTVTASYADADDYLALYYKKAPPGTTQLKPEDLDDLKKWTPVPVIGGKGQINDNPGVYFYRYEAGNTAGNKVVLKFIQGKDLLEAPITLGSGVKTYGGNVFRIW